MLTKLNYGVIGTGHLGSYHIQQALKISHINVIGCYDINQSLSCRIAKEHQIQNYDNLGSLLKECDALSIATPASHHHEVAIKALESGCHVFIEKPITDTLSQAKELIDLSIIKNKVIQVGHIERFNPAYKFLIKTNLTPKFIESHRLSPFNIRGTDVNVILDLMIHDIDLIINLVQSPIKNIFANGVSHLSNSIDLANVRLEFHNGCVANLTASRLSPTKLRKMRVFSKDAYYSLNFDTFLVETYRTCPNKSNTKLSNHNYIKDLFTSNNKIIQYYSDQLNATNALYAELDSFINSILYGSRVMVTAENATLALETALKIEKYILIE